MYCIFFSLRLSRLFSYLDLALYLQIPILFWRFIFGLSCEQGEDICVALQTHINDVMLRRYSRNKNIPNGQVSNEVDTTATLSTKPAGLEVYEKHVQEMSKLLEESQRKIDQASPKRDMIR